MEDVRFEKFEAGTKYRQWVTRQDGYRIEWHETGLLLYAMLNGINSLEREQFTSNKPISIRFVVIADVCYFVFKFGNMPWADSPFSPTLYINAGRTFEVPLIEDNKGLALTVFLIDSSTGELCHIRLIGLGHDFSQKWKIWADEAVKKPLSLEEYSEQVDTTYSHFESLDLAVMANENNNQYIAY